MSSDVTLVVLSGGLRPPLFIISLLVGDDPCHLMLLLSFCAYIVILRGGLRPPLFIISLLVGDDSCHLMLLLATGPAAGCRPEAGRLKQKNVYSVCFVCLRAKMHSFCLFALRAKAKKCTLFFVFKQNKYTLFLH